MGNGRGKEITEAVWEYVNAHKDTGVTTSMLTAEFGRCRVMLLAQLEAAGYLCYQDGYRIYPYRKAEPEPPKKSIPYYFTRWLDDEPKEK